MERQHKIIVAIVLAAAVALLGTYISAKTENEDSSALLRGNQNLLQRQLSQAIDPKTVTVKGDNQGQNVVSSRLPPFQFMGPFDDIRDRTNLDKRHDGCMRFKCSAAKEAHCQDHYAETDYDHPNNPPCCTHILRDMLKLVDTALGSLDLEYFTVYGTLLGLVRNDHVIPWTADNDFLMSFAVHEELIRNQDYIREKFGLRLYKYMYHRVCVAENFMGGKLNRWKSTSMSVPGRKTYIDIFPYSDFFIGDVDPSSGRLIDERGCGFDVPVFRPAKRISVYNNTFQVSVPNDFISVLEKEYGPNWKTPDKGSKMHGNTKCVGYSKEFYREAGREMRREEDKKWLNMWNKILGRLN